MTDFLDKLRSSDTSPKPRVDMDAIYARAQRIRSRRTAGIGSVALLIAALTVFFVIPRTQDGSLPVNRVGDQASRTNQGSDTEAGAALRDSDGTATQQPDDLSSPSAADRNAEPSTSVEVFIGLASASSNRPLEFRVKACNQTGKTQPLEFMSGARFDVAVFRQGESQSYWRWSEDRLFTSVIESGELADGQCDSTKIQWPAGATPSGAYEMLGTLTIANPISSQRSVFCFDCTKQELQQARQDFGSKTLDLIPSA